MEIWTCKWLQVTFREEEEEEEEGKEEVWRWKRGIGVGMTSSGLNAVLLNQAGVNEPEIRIHNQAAQK